jgi:hypothetical protein
VYWRLRDGVPAIWKTYRVLFIGNSFTYFSNVPKNFENIAKNLGEAVIADAVTVGSHHLYEFADSNDEYGKQVDQKLAANQYDYVILQEHSTYPVSNNSKFVQGAKDLKAKVDKTQKHATVRLYATWGFKDAADTYTEGDIPAFEGKIREAYKNLATALKVKVHPVGQAFTKIYQDYKNINLYYEKDNKHPNAVSAHLSALVHVSSIFDLDVRKSTWNTSFNHADNDTEVATIPEDTLTILRNVAREVSLLNK